MSKQVRHVKYLTIFLPLFKFILNVRHVINFFVSYLANRISTMTLAGRTVALVVNSLSA